MTTIFCIWHILSLTFILGRKPCHMEELLKIAHNHNQNQHYHVDDKRKIEYDSNRKSRHSLGRKQDTGKTYATTSTLHWFSGVKQVKYCIPLPKIGTYPIFPFPWSTKSSKISGRRITLICWRLASLCITWIQ